MEGCWEYDCHARPSFSSILQSLDTLAHSTFNSLPGRHIFLTRIKHNSILLFLNCCPEKGGGAVIFLMLMFPFIQISSFIFFNLDHFTHKLDSRHILKIAKLRDRGTTDNIWKLKRRERGVGAIIPNIWEQKS